MNAPSTSNSFYLSSYSPQLNPEERLNVDLNQAMGKQVPVRTNLHKLSQAANDLMTTLQEATERVMAYFQDRHFQDEA